MSRPIRSIVSIELPLPPSVNKAFASGRAGSKFLMKSSAYKLWSSQVHDEIGGSHAHLPKLVRGPYGLWVSLPSKMRGDIDNRVKLLSDALTGSQGCLGIVPDDAAMDALYVERRGAPPDRVVATVVTLADWPSYLEMRLL